MSAYVCVPVSVLGDASLSASARVLYGLVVGLSGQTGFSWASNAWFAAAVGCSDRQVRRLLGELFERGLVRIETHLDDQGVSGRRVWPLALVESVDGDRTGASEGRTVVSAPPDNGVRPPRTPMSTKYSNLNSKINKAVSVGSTGRRKNADPGRESFLGRVRVLARDCRRAGSLADGPTSEAVRQFGGWSAIGRMSEYEFSRCGSELYARFLEVKNG